MQPFPDDETFDSGLVDVEDVVSHFLYSWSPAFHIPRLFIFTLHTGHKYIP